MQTSSHEETPSSDFPLDVQFPGSRDEALAFFLRVMLIDNFIYATAMNEGNVKKAKSAALAHAGIWAALRAGDSSLRFVDTRTGEVSIPAVRGPDVPDPFLALEEYLVDYQGIPEMLSPLRRAQRKKVIKVDARLRRTWGPFAR